MRGGQWNVGERLIAGCDCGDCRALGGGIRAIEIAACKKMLLRFRLKEGLPADFRGRMT